MFIFYFGKTIYMDGIVDSMTAVKAMLICMKTFLSCMPDQTMYPIIRLLKTFSSESALFAILPASFKEFFHTKITVRMIVITPTV